MNNSDDSVALLADGNGLGTQSSWQLNALTEALGDLTLTVSDSLSVGRGNDNDVVLGSKEVSRNHALLSVLNDKLYIKDLDSSNGTFINDERIENNESKHLKANDKVGFASFIFQVGAQVEAATDTEADNIEIADTPTVDNELEVLPDTAAIAMPVVTEPVIEPTVPEAEIATENEEFVETIEEPELTAVSEPVIDSPVEPVFTEETGLENSVPAAAVDEQVSEDIVLDNNAEEPVVKETIIGAVLSATDSSTVDEPIVAVEPTVTTDEMTAMTNDNYDDKKPVISAPVVDEPLISEPLMQDKSTHQQPIVSSEHDKTTTTELQEEADLDVLRAKQAATSQFSGTANLGAGRDLGTQGNNAADQAITNPANAEQVNKQPSGSWFIWVFMAIIIIGLALWLFNMGG